MRAMLLALMGLFLAGCVADGGYGRPFHGGGYGYAPPHRVPHFGRPVYVVPGYHAPFHRGPSYRGYGHWGHVPRRHGHWDGGFRAPPVRYHAPPRYDHGWRGHDRRGHDRRDWGRRGDDGRWHRDERRRWRH